MYQKYRKKSFYPLLVIHRESEWLNHEIAVDWTLSYHRQPCYVHGFLILAFYFDTKIRFIYNRESDILLETVLSGVLLDFIPSKEELLWWLSVLIPLSLRPACLFL